MHLYKKNILFLILIYTLFGNASEVEKLLNQFDQKNALSQKTIDENKGHLVLFTRDRLEKMHARTLKDVFKTTPAIYYHENRYSLPDPLASGAFEPYRSNFIRLYIDGVEVTQGWLGSGVVLYGDMNIDFADHIEFYYAIPSFDTSVEPAYLTIFIYSKNPERDNGGKVSLAQGSRGYNEQNINYGEVKDDFSYMVNVSHTNAKRSKADNGTSTPLSRDFERTQLMSYVKTDNQIAHLQVMKKNSDALAGLSLDATPLVSTLDFLNVHLDYGIDFNERWRAQFAYDRLRSDIQQSDDAPLYLGRIPLPLYDLNAKTKNSTYSAELTYKNSIAKHHITTGIKGRWKQWNSLSVSGIGSIPLNFSQEDIFSIFFQDQYALSDAELLTLGIEYNKMIRYGTIHNDDLLQLRLGYIYTSEHWSYKSYLYRTMFALDPLSRFLIPGNADDIAPQVTKGLTQELSYTEEDYRVRLMLLMMQDEDGLVQNTGAGKTKYFFSIFNYDYNFDPNNKLNLQLYYAQYRDIADVNKLEDYSGYMSLSNSYEKFDFYNGVVWHQNSIDNKNYFDLTSSITWNFSENLTITLKGQNLLNKSKETNLFRVNPTTGTLMQPLSISPIDQSITLELEYTF